MMTRKIANASDIWWTKMNRNRLCMHGTRYETIDTLTSLDCALLSNSRPVSGYWPIFSAMQISAASKSATLCLLELRLVLI